MAKKHIEVVEESYYGTSLWIVYVKGLLVTMFNKEEEANYYVRNIQG